ncbi:MAG: hypothetical protein PHQ12_00740 [Chthoniobacteraceae bacterium]|nr:hypothetical protein [Chthoniobacteraceae bacterium]
MQIIDWSIIVASFLVVIAIAVYTQRYMRSVADFLSAGRVAGRYVLAVSKGEMGAGAVVFVAGFEVFNQGGFSLQWWELLTAPIWMLLTVTGFVIYRYRETRAMTLAQFFEIRYSRPFRVFTGFLGFAAGIINFGIIPAVGARFMAYFFGLPPSFHFYSWEIPTYIPVMGAFLGLTLLVTLAGGLITLMVADCVEGIISQILYVVIIGVLLWMFCWTDIAQTLGNRPAGHSLLNPFDSLDVKDFNIWFVAMGIVTGIYGTMAWQNQSAFNSAGLTAHESRMANVLGKWRFFGKQAVLTLLAVCAMTYLTHPDFTTQSQPTREEIAGISQPKIQRQMTIPLAVENLLPEGVKGALCAVLLMGLIGGDGIALHSWGSLFVQDVVIPLRKKAFSPKQHIRALRWSMVGVALAAFLMGSLFRQTEYISMWWSVTTAFYVGGAGAAIIGGLYWKKGTTAGAWSGLLTGSGLSGGGILLRQIYQDQFPLNGMQISFFSSLIAVAVYVIVSLLTCRQDFDMDRMLHRGAYALDPAKHAGPAPKRSLWRSLLGFDENFTKFDKVLTSSITFYTLALFFVALIGTIWNLISPWSMPVWSAFWYIKAIIIPVTLAVVTAIWFTWGGILDLRHLFQRLRLHTVNAMDNGMVINHQNVGEAPEAPQPAKPPVTVDK